MITKSIVSIRSCDDKGKQILGMGGGGGGGGGNPNEKVGDAHHLTYM